MPAGAMPGAAVSCPRQRSLNFRPDLRLRTPRGAAVGGIVSWARASAARTAAPAFTMPQPRSLVQPRVRVAVFFISRITDRLPRRGFAARTSATAPTTCGAAIEVPDR